MNRARFLALCSLVIVAALAGIGCLEMFSGAQARANFDTPTAAEICDGYDFGIRTELVQQTIEGVPSDVLYVFMVAAEVKHVEEDNVIVSEGPITLPLTEALCWRTVAGEWQETPLELDVDNEAAKIVLQGDDRFAAGEGTLIMVHLEGVHPLNPSVPIKITDTLPKTRVAGTP